MATNFEEMGITFKIIDRSMHRETADFLWQNFFPDEPVLRSLNVQRGWFWDTVFLKDVLNDNSSFAALDKDGKIIGVRFMERSLFNVAKILIPNMRIALKLFDQLEQDPFKQMERLNCPKLYEGKALCTDRNIRSKGLGTELVRRSMEYAKEQGCEYMYVPVSGMYSQRVFEKLGFEVLTEVVYAEFKNRRGELYLKDTREHKKIQTVLKKL